MLTTGIIFDSKAGAKIIVPSKCSHRESQLLQKLSEYVGGNEICLALLHGLFISSTLSVSQYAENTLQKLHEYTAVFADEPVEDQVFLACIHLAVKELSHNLRSLLSGLWIFQGYFAPVTATAIFMPDFSYLESEISPIDAQLEELNSLGFLVQKNWHFSPIQVEVYRLPSLIGRYCKNCMQQALPPDKLLLQFGDVYAETAKLIAPNVSLQPDILQIARCISQDLLGAIQHTHSEVQVNLLLHCAKIVHALGDLTLAETLCKEGARRATSENVQLDIEAARLAFHGFYFQDFKRVFLGKPTTPQEKFDQAIYPVAESLSQLGILRPVRLNQYEALISKPLFTSINEVLWVLTDPTNIGLEEVEKSCKAAIRTLRKGGFEPEVGLFCFGLARIYMKLGRFKQALTQLENVNRSTFATQDIVLRGAVWHERGCIHAHLNEIAEAKGDFWHAVSYWSDCEDRHKISAAELSSGILTSNGKYNPQFSIKLVERAISTLKDSGLSKNAYDLTIEQMQSFLNQLHHRSETTTNNTL